MHPTSLSSIEVPNAPAIAGETKPRIAANRTDGTMSTNEDGVTNMHLNFLHGMKTAGETADLLGHRPLASDGSFGAYEWFTYGQVLDKAQCIGSGMAKTGIKPQECVGIFSPNRIEWSFTEHATYMYNIVSVPMYDTLGIEAIKHMANETEMQLVFVAPEKLATLLGIWTDIPTLKILCVYGQIPESAKSAIDELPEGCRVITLAELETTGKQDEFAPMPETPAGLDDPCTICYTSGTTGLPKGVVLTHMNFLSVVGSFKERMRIGQMLKFGAGDTHISILPLAHCLERAVHAAITNIGCRIGYGCGDIRKILDDINALKPSIMVGVPRIFNRIHDQVWSQVKSRGGIASKLFNHAYSTKKTNLLSGTNTHWLWDRLVFKAVREKFGGNIRLIISGSAPISHDVMDFLRIAFSTTVYEGYGLTETTGPCGTTVITEMKAGNVGCTFGNCVYKLVSVPEMEYTVDDMPYPRGEICVKGHNVFTRYYRRPDLTAEAFDQHGYLRTGDIGQFDDLGNLVIIDRKKNMFKLAQGEYVAPERIENVITNCPLIDQAFVYGDSLQSQLVGVMVPNEEFLRREIADSKELSHLEGKSLKDICADKAASDYLCRVINSWGRKSDLKGYEIPKNIHLESEPFSVENNLLTPTLKIKRVDAKKLYKDILDQLYAALNKN